MKKLKGFTLVELIIVIAVLAILLAVVVPSFQGMESEGNFARGEGDLNALKTAVISYRRHNNTYPADLATLTSASPKLIQAIPNDPFNPVTSSYNYTRVLGDATCGDYFIIWSNGPDLTDGTPTANGSCEVDGSSIDDIIVSNLPVID